MASDWPRTFFTARLFLFSIIITAAVRRLGLGDTENFMSRYIMRVIITIIDIIMISIVTVLHAVYRH